MKKSVLLLSLFASTLVWSVGLAICDAVGVLRHDEPFSVKVHGVLVFALPTGLLAALIFDVFIRRVPRRRCFVLVVICGAAIGFAFGQWWVKDGQWGVKEFMGGIAGGLAGSLISAMVARRVCQMRY